ncbi:hypothetical protein [Helicobacter labetoulli]|uniref:hypothetical protein n=1 Tax=Helicobacter labetoulli TaxID=2315333 RepID=UPI000EF7288E|nr:hypothetical protein [Helicobacter labetoulli]
MQIIPHSTLQTTFNPLHTLYTNQRTTRHFKHKANHNPKAQKRRIAFFAFAIFFSQNPKSLQIIPQSTQNKSF